MEELGGKEREMRGVKGLKESLFCWISGSWGAIRRSGAPEGVEGSVLGPICVGGSVKAAVCVYGAVFELMEASRGEGGSWGSNQASIWQTRAVREQISGQEEQRAARAAFWGRGPIIFGLKVAKNLEESLDQ